MCNLIKQGTFLGPILSNCSLDDICSEGNGHNMDTVEIKAMEFVDDIADPNNGYFEALKSNQIISYIQKRKHLTFSAEKCKTLKFNSRDNSNSLFLSGIKLRLIMSSDIMVMFSIMYQSIPSLTIPPPPGNFFDDRIPHRPGKKEFKTPTLRAYKNEVKPHPRGHFPQLFTIKT